MVSDSENIRLLGTWNQVAMRAYVRQVFCFPIDEQLDDFDELCAHIRLGLSLACSPSPHFAGKIRLGSNATKGKVYVCTTASDEVSFSFFDDRRPGAESESESESESKPESQPFGWSYPELKAQGFPCKAFVGPRFSLPYDLTEDGPGIPVTEVHARVIRGGGLLLCVFIHHSISDGIGMRNFIATFAGFTLRRENEPGLLPEHAANIDVEIPEDQVAALIESPSSFDELLDDCPEYTMLPGPTGPTAPCRRQEWVPSLGHVPKTGRIFKFSQAKISTLKSVAQNWARNHRQAGVVSRATTKSTAKVTTIQGTWSPSTFACLAAVTWSFCTAARLETRRPQRVNGLKSVCGSNGHGDGDDHISTNHNNNNNNGGSPSEKTHLLVPASWTRRAFKHCLDGYASNAVCMPRICASVDSHGVVSGSEQTTTTATTNGSDTRNKDEELGRLIYLIDSAIAAIDDKFVATRTAMFRAAPDPRFIGINIDPQDPLDFIVNSWRHLGADILFGLPGLEPEGTAKGSRGRSADAVRRAQPEWNMGAGLVLPGKGRGSDYEMLVTLEEAAMRRLLANPAWMRCVSETVE
ncbi:C-8 acyltransferase [Metarhizium rileyi]|uniref:C-8 acyltransferase n=1 Tax=Metarhizium rileyi (strain RCEF 4871) TaxID=1649241 RepID=A0A167H8W9_METRR|nr:C-8 acyltransferase [Metarhizium rileyi RCEF 4871]